MGKYIRRIVGIWCGIDTLLYLALALFVLIWNIVQVNKVGELFGWILVVELFTLFGLGAWVLLPLGFSLGGFVLTIRSWYKESETPAISVIQIMSALVSIGCSLVLGLPIYMLAFFYDMDAGLVTKIVVPIAVTVSVIKLLLSVAGCFGYPKKVQRVDNYNRASKSV